MGLKGRYLKKYSDKDRGRYSSNLLKLHYILYVLAKHKIKNEKTSKKGIDFVSEV